MLRMKNPAKQIVLDMITAIEKAKELGADMLGIRQKKMLLQKLISLLMKWL
jgi:hypothetical protein